MKESQMFFITSHIYLAAGAVSTTMPLLCLSFGLAAVVLSVFLFLGEQSKP